MKIDISCLACSCSCAHCFQALAGWEPGTGYFMPCRASLYYVIAVFNHNTGLPTYSFYLVSELWLKENIGGAIQTVNFKTMLLQASKCQINRSAIIMAIILRGSITNFKPLLEPPEFSFAFTLSTPDCKTTDMSQNDGEQRLATHLTPILKVPQKLNF